MWHRLNTSFLFDGERQMIPFYNMSGRMVCWNDPTEGWCVQSLADFGRSMTGLPRGAILAITGECNGRPCWGDNKTSPYWKLYYVVGQWYLVADHGYGYIPHEKYEDDLYTGDEFYTPQIAFRPWGTVDSTVTFVPPPDSDYAAITLTYAQEGQTLRDTAQLLYVSAPYGFYGQHKLLTPCWHGGGIDIIRVDERHNRWRGVTIVDSRFIVSGNVDSADGWYELTGEPELGQNAIAKWHRMIDDEDTLQPSEHQDITFVWQGTTTALTSKYGMYEVNVWR